jgi:hypothetical protein
MATATIIAAASLIALVVLVLTLVVRGAPVDQDVGPVVATATAIIPSTQPAPPTHADSGFLYGRITVDGTAYQGRLRWGGDQEAFWGDYFNGAKSENPWAAHAPRDPTKEARRIEIFGFEIGGPDRSHLQRLFMARFGDIARIEARFAHVQVTLKSGSVTSLDRFAAGDIDDGVRVWDARRGVVDLDARQIRTIEFLPTAQLVGAPGRLHGVVRTPQGEFTGFIQWDQQDSVSSDTLDGRTGEGQQSLRYDTIRSIARQSRDSALVTLLDGRELALSNSREVGRGHRGIYVDDARYGRVLISWDAFERVQFGPGGSGPAYFDFPPGRRLVGSVTTRDGRSLAGQLVYDLDESETTETLDVSFGGVDYVIPFGLIASLAPPGSTGPGRVILHDGGELLLERSGDVGGRNAGMLIFVAGGGSPEYVPWAEVQRIDFERPAGVNGA